MAHDTADIGTDVGPGGHARQPRLPRRTGRPGRDWLGRALASDPGLARLLSAVQTIATIGAAMLAEWLFVRGTHALQLAGPALSPTVVAAQHHGVTVIAILLGAVIGMMTGFSASMFATARGLLTEFAVTPVCMVAGLALGLALAPYRVPSLAVLIVVLGLSGYARRFGPIGMLCGVLVFMGNFFGFFLGAQLRLTDLGWLSAEIGVGVLVSALAQFTVFYPRRGAALRRMRRSYAARTRAVARAASAVFDEPGPRASRRLHRSLIRLNEAALMMDAHLGEPGVLPPGHSAAAAHQGLFDAELSLSNAARFTETLAGTGPGEPVAELVRQALAAVAELDLIGAEVAARELLARTADGEPDIVAHRLAVSVLGFVEAGQTWQAGQDGEPGFEPAVQLFGGFLPGSALVSATASGRAGPGGPSRARGWTALLHRWDRVRLTPPTRVAIQLTVAVTVAVILGDAVSGRRFYWALIAVWATFMGVHNAGEQVRKGVNRVVGTVLGVLLGAVGAHLVGSSTTWAIVVILGSLFLGLYLFRVSYAFMVVAITIMVSQLYVQLDEYSDSLLALRLAETALGAGVAVLTLLFVVPLRTGRVVHVATGEYVQALYDATTAALDRLRGGESTAELRAALRRLDAAYQTLLATLRPFRLPLLGLLGGDGFLGGDAGVRPRLLQPASAARHYLRSALGELARVPYLDPAARARLDDAGATLQRSLGELAAHLADPQPREYVRSAALFDLAATQLSDCDYNAPVQHVLRDLQLLDGAAAALADAAGLTVRALDTTAEPASRA